MDTEKTILNRRSVRYFTKQEITKKQIEKILKSAIWAPSGLNNQPWRFKVITDQKQNKQLAQFTKYEYIIKESTVSICVFIDKNSIYNREKDIMAIGACIQNMLLQSKAMGIGSCWLGEILNKKNEVRKFLNLSSDYELMAVISFGYAKKKPGKSSRYSLKKFILD